jgi:hypothetical protein
MTSALIIALSAYQLVALPRAIEGFWENLSPWLSNPDEEIAFLKAQTRPLLLLSGECSRVAGLRSRLGTDWKLG